MNSVIQFDGIFGEFEKSLNSLDSKYRVGRINDKYITSLKKFMKLHSTFERAYSTDFEFNPHVLLSIFRSRALIAESLSWIGHLEEQISFINQYYFSEVSSELEELCKEIRIKPETKTHISNLDLLSKKLLREKCRIMVSYSICHRRRNEVDRAKDLLNSAETVVNIISNELFPCHGTKALIQYFIGALALKCDQLEEASAYFIKSIENYSKRVDFKERVLRDTSEDNEEFLKSYNRSKDFEFSKVRIGIVLGIGRSHITKRQGMVDVALNSNIRPARFLISNRDVIHSTLIDVFENILIRDKDPENDKILEISQKIISKAAETFNDLGHVSYFHRALYEESMTLYYRYKINKKTIIGEDIVKKALNNIALIKTAAKNNGDYVWLAQYIVTEAAFYIERDQFRFAELCLTEGINDILEASSGHPPNVGIIHYVRLFIIRARARIELDDFEGAEEDLNIAASTNQKSLNSKTIEAIIAFEKSRFYIQNKVNKNFSKAKEFLLMGKKILDDNKIEIKSLHIMYKEIENDLFNKMKYQFPINRNSLSLQENEKNFRKFLIQYVLEENNNNFDKTAEVLGVDRVTLYRLRKKLKI